MNCKEETKLFSDKEIAFVNEHIKADFEIAFSQNIMFVDNQLVEGPPRALVDLDEAELSGYFCMNCGGIDIDNLLEHVRECMMPAGFKMCKDCKKPYNPLIHHQCPECHGVLEPWTCYYCGHNYKEDGASGTIEGHPACTKCVFEKIENNFNSKAYFLESLFSEIWEDHFDEGEKESTGCGLPWTPISKKFKTKEDMLKWVEHNYGYPAKYFENSVDKGEMLCSITRADHSKEQNGGWMEPTEEEVKLWKKGKLMLYAENITLIYHTM